MTYKKKLIEVALPLEDINRESAREKTIRHGHPSTLHLWWARRPLAACRAVLFASLVDDPSECVKELLADAVKRAAAEKELKARKKAWAGLKAVFTKASVAGMKSVVDPGPEPKIEDVIEEQERERLFNIIRELVKWDNANDERVLGMARNEILRSTHGKPPQIHDPFCGGGSIPLEAQRLGLSAKASDLNPVAVLINTALIDIPCRFEGRAPVNKEARKKLGSTGSWARVTGMANDLVYYGERIRAEAEKRVGLLYPPVELPKSEGQTRVSPLAYLWVRTVECPNPACRGRMPLIRSYWLSKRKGNEFFALPVLDRSQKIVSFEIKTSGEPPKETSNRNGAECIFCGQLVRKQELREQSLKYGVEAIPIAAVCDGRNGRIYLPFSANDMPKINRPSADYLALPITNDRRWFSPPLYGLVEFRDLFTDRQIKVLDTICEIVRELKSEVEASAREAGFPNDERGLCEGGVGAKAYADAIAVYLAFGVNKAVTRNCTLAIWEPGMGRLAGAFGRQAMPMTWLYAETNPLAGAGGDIAGTIASVAEVVEKLPATPQGNAVQRSAVNSQADKVVISTDPPYYDNIGYADLSDFFYIWLRHVLGRDFPDLFGTVLVPKSEELIAATIRFGGDRAKADKFFEDGLSQAFDSMRRVHMPEYPLTLFYAFKQAETTEAEEDSTGTEVFSTGWETMLEGLLKSGFSIDGTWPMRTESVASLKKDISALASSIVLVCRLRPADAVVASRRDFLAALKKELPTGLRYLQKGNIAPVDLAQAAIGPGMAVFSRYAQVLEADGAPMSVRTALSLINQSLDEVLAEQEGEFDADTRWALAWFDQNGFNEGAYGLAETLCTAKNTSVSGMVDAGILAAKGGKVRLLKKEELQADWNPATDDRLTVWEATHHLIRSLDSGEQVAAALLKKLGAMAEVARDLSYRLYTVCERRKWSQDAIGYNALVLSWPDLKRQADEQKHQGPAQRELI
jgi:putative DNA methylase